MAISFTSIQKRRLCGQKCHFSDTGPHLIIDIDPNPELKTQYVTVSTIEKETQCSRAMSVHEANTLLHPTNSEGMNHTIGGWPCDVDPKDEDQVARFKKKIQKDESFICTIKKLGGLVENFVMENNSVDIYEEYFMDENIPDDAVNKFKTLSVFRDYSEKKRKVQDLSWALDCCKLAVAHAVSESCGEGVNGFHESYVWDIENSSVPYCVLLPQGALSCIEYSSRDLELLLGGYRNGQIGLWDVRTGGNPQRLTSLTTSHKESVTDMKWISSKTGLEFFSSSTDGKLIFWDSRNLNSPTHMMHFDMNIPEETETSNVYSITCLEYDPSLPHRFTLGTEQGVILSCNRKFKEVKNSVTACYSTHKVPVMNITRNPFFPKLFASCCAWDAKIWSDDLTVSPILYLCSQDGYCTDATWSPLHASFLFVTKTTGHLELWDILIKNHEPIVSLKLESDGLTRVYPKQQGEQIVCGTTSGCVHLLNVPEYYASTKQEKNLVASMIDREGKREKFLEGKTREQRMRIRYGAKQAEIANSPRGESPKEKTISLEDKADVSETGAEEFVSKFDPNLKGDDEEVGDITTEKAFFDFQFCDVLNSVLDTVKEQNSFG